MSRIIQTKHSDDFKGEIWLELPLKSFEQDLRWYLGDGCVGLISLYNGAHVFLIDKESNLRIDIPMPSVAESMGQEFHSLFTLPNFFENLNNQHKWYWGDVKWNSHDRNNFLDLLQVLHEVHKQDPVTWGQVFRYLYDDFTSVLRRYYPNHILHLHFTDSFLDREPRRVDFYLLMCMLMYLKKRGLQNADQEFANLIAIRISQHEHFLTHRSENGWPHTRAQITVNTLVQKYITKQ